MARKPSRKGSRPASEMRPLGTRPLSFEVLEGRFPAGSILYLPVGPARPFDPGEGHLSYQVSILGAGGVRRKDSSRDLWSFTGRGAGGRGSNVPGVDATHLALLSGVGDGQASASEAPGPREGGPRGHGLSRTSSRTQGGFGFSFDVGLFPVGIDGLVPGGRGGRKSGNEVGLPGAPALPGSPAAGTGAVAAGDAGAMPPVSLVTSPVSFHVGAGEDAGNELLTAALASLAFGAPPRNHRHPATRPALQASGQRTNRPALVPGVPGEGVENRAAPSNIPSARAALDPSRPAPEEESTAAGAGGTPAAAPGPVQTTPGTDGNGSGGSVGQSHEAAPASHSVRLGFDH